MPRLPVVSSLITSSQEASFWKGGTFALLPFSGEMIDFLHCSLTSHIQHHPKTSLSVSVLRWNVSGQVVSDIFFSICSTLKYLSTCHKATKARFGWSSYVFSLWSLSLSYLPTKWNVTLLVHFFDPNIMLKCTIIYFLLLRKWSILSSVSIEWYTILYAAVFLQILDIKRVFNSFYPVES